MKFTVLAALLASTQAAEIDTGFGPKFNIVKKDNNAQTITATVPANNYLVLALGDAHDAAVDMLYFGGKSSNNYKDMKGKEGTMPTEDPSGKRNLNCNVSGSGPYTFDCSRDINTGDADTDTKLECGKSYTFEYMGSGSTADLQAEPAKHGSFKMSLDSSCVVTLEKVAKSETGAMTNVISAASVLAATYMLF